jgi:aspartate/methionine/tyrosine aminotransferase
VAPTPARLAGRLDHIEPFYVMELAKAASRIAASSACDPARGGEPMIFLNIGEPDFTAAPAVQAAAAAALAAGRTQYTQATGLQALREAISGWYAQRFGVDVDPGRIVVTAGASAALQLVCLALFEPGDEVLMADPSYPCNRHFVAATGATPRLLPAGPEARFQPGAASVPATWTAATRGVLLASPGNPTGTSVAPAEMAAIAQAVAARGGITLVDEIYLGLSYDERFGQTALALPGAGLADQVVSINSFSKYFGMTGWRLGWLVLPPWLVGPVERLAQNLYICPSTLAQHAALACFEPASLAEFERRRGEYAHRREHVLRALQRLRLPVPVEPDGAFYAWADCTAHADDSWALCHALIDRAHVVLTPGRDFGPHGARGHLRLSYATSDADIEEGVGRIAALLGEAR